jgi:hypothetical protein
VVVELKVDVPVCRVVVVVKICDKVVVVVDNALLGDSDAVEVVIAEVGEEDLAVLEVGIEDVSWIADKFVFDLVAFLSSKSMIPWQRGRKVAVDAEFMRKESVIVLPRFRAKR